MSRTDYDYGRTDGSPSSSDPVDGRPRRRWVWRTRSGGSEGAEAARGSAAGTRAGTDPGPGGARPADSGRDDAVRDVGSTRDGRAAGIGGGNTAFVPYSGERYDAHPGGRARSGGLIGWARRRFGKPRSATGDAADPGGLDAVTRACDAWFAREAAELDQEAARLARAAAVAGLPRLDVDYAEVAEEATLAARCRAVFHGWEERVRTRVQDALQASTRRAGERLRSFDHETAALDGVLTEMRDTRAELRDAESAAEAGHAYLEVRPFLSRWLYIPLILALVLVDWIANVPVFSELLPKDPGADAAWRELAARAETMGLWGGPYRIWARTVHSIDASLLALGVIVFLVYLAHVCGESVRRLLSHAASEAPAAALAIRAHRRQFILPALFSLVGIVSVVGVLWLARDRLEGTTAQRVAEVETRIEATERQLEAARAGEDLIEIGRLEQELAGLAVLRAQRIDRADYALVIGRMNVPILLLNVVLAIAAALAGYLVTRGAVRGALVSPRASALRRHLGELRTEAVRRRGTLHRLDAEIGGEFARVAYLLRSRPLSGWEARAERLRSVVPRFRSENARLRGIDVGNVAAFRQPARLELTPRAEDGLLTPPAELETYRALHESLRERAAQVLRRMHHESAPESLAVGGVAMSLDGAGSAPLAGPGAPSASRAPRALGAAHGPAPEIVLPSGTDGISATERAGDPQPQVAPEIVGLTGAGGAPADGGREEP